MRRRLLSIPARLSLLLALATIVLWVWSMLADGGFTAIRTTTPTADWDGDGPGRTLAYTVGLLDRGLLLQWYESSGDVAPSPWRVHRDVNNAREHIWYQPYYSPHRQWWGFECVNFSWKSAPRERRHLAGIVLPLWLPVVLFTLFPVLMAIRRSQRRKRGTGYCASCGYDLRATPERCPECGTMPAR